MSSPRLCASLTAACGLLLGCHSPLPCTLEPHPSLLRGEQLTWPAEAGEGWLEVEGEEGQRQRQPVSGGLAPVLGWPAEHQLSWSLELSSGRCEGSSLSGALPSELTEPELLVPAAPASGDWEYMLVPIFELFGGRSDLVLLDRDGRIRWAMEGGEEELIVDAQLHRSEEGLMHNRFDSDFQEDLAVIQHRSWEGELVEEWRTELGHHMFLQLPEGGLAWQSLDVRSWIDPETGEELDLVGDRLMETLSDGSTRTVSSVWDWLPVEENLFFSLPSLYPQGVDWSHGNSLELSPDGEHYLLSLGNAGVVAQLDRESGEPVWMSGAQGIPLHEGSLHFEHQHGVRWLPDGSLLMFASDFTEAASGAVSYAWREGRLEETWRGGFDAGLLAPMLGQAQRLPGGQTLINYGGAGQVQLLSPESELLWALALPEQVGFAQATLLSSLPWEEVE